MAAELAVSIEDVRAAASRIEGMVHRTPVGSRNCWLRTPSLCQPPSAVAATEPLAAWRPHHRSSPAAPWTHSPACTFTSRPRCFKSERNQIVDTSTDRSPAAAHQATLPSVLLRHVHPRSTRPPRCGAFKARGALNAVFSLPEEEAARGVVTHSSGNHGAALAFAARLRGIPATVVVPANTPEIKRAAIRGYGVQPVVCAPTIDAREAACREIQERTGAAFVPPYNHPAVIAGQGTIALEFLEQAGAGRRGLRGRERRWGCS